MSVFTTIAFGLCAYMAQSPNQSMSLIFVGHIDNGLCDPFVFFPDSHGQRVTIEGRTYGVTINDKGGILYFDDKTFYFSKDSI